MFEDVVIAGYGTAVQRLPLAADEAPLSTVAIINEATRRALAMAEIDRRQVGHGGVMAAHAVALLETE